jgi:hypothetical protein
VVNTERIRGGWVGICFVAKNWRILWDDFGAHFFMFKFVVKICLTAYLSIFDLSALIIMPQLQSVLTRVLSFSTFSSVFTVV